MDSVPPTMSELGRKKVGDPVSVKLPTNRCTTTFGKGGITGLVSLQSVLLEGMPRHTRDLRSSQISRSSTSSEDYMHK